MVRALNLYGCFVKTGHSFKLGTKVLLTMTHDGTHFTATGRIVNQNETGIGVEFTGMSSEDKSRLEACLAELARNEAENKSDS
jgi:Tfp pilus assembly protein PilZ